MIYFMSTTNSDLQFELRYDSCQVITFLVSLRNRLISGGLEPVLSHTKDYV